MPQIGCGDEALVPGGRCLDSTPVPPLLFSTGQRGQGKSWPSHESPFSIPTFSPPGIQWAPSLCNRPSLILSLRSPAQSSRRGPIDIPKSPGWPRAFDSGRGTGGGTEGLGQKAVLDWQAGSCRSGAWSAWPPTSTRKRPLRPPVSTDLRLPSIPPICGREASWTQSAPLGVH